MSIPGAHRGQTNSNLLNQRAFVARLGLQKKLFHIKDQRRSQAYTRIMHTHKTYVSIICMVSASRLVKHVKMAHEPMRALERGNGSDHWVAE